MNREYCKAHGVYEDTIYRCPLCHIEQLESKISKIRKHAESRLGLRKDILKNIKSVLAENVGA